MRQEAHYRDIHDQAGESTKRVDNNKIGTDSQADGTGSM